ncbi:MAG: TolC family protein [Thermodesulfobacteriota bacterium]|nr:TolC family protein [Thermodesulfobacteriota bacterium]
MSQKVFYCVLCIFLSLALIMPAGAKPLEEGVIKGHVLSLRDALAMGMQRNLDLQAVKMDIPINTENVVVFESEFDPVFDASVSSFGEEIPTASKVFDEDVDRYTWTGADVGISKKFMFGLESRLAFETNRSRSNSTLYGLRPQYRDVLVLDLTQPLLRDFGMDPNTADLRVSENQIRQAAYGYMQQAQNIGKDVEVAYYDLGNALAILRYRNKSRVLALELVKGNQKKFDAGIVPITEVQEAQTALASRDEQIVFAMQQVEILSNRLKDLLEIRPGDPLYGELFITDPVIGINQTFPDLEKALAIALKNRPDLQQERLEVANQEIQIEYYSNQKLPRIDLGASLGLNGLSGHGNTSSPYEGGYFDAISGMGKGDGHEWSVGLQLSYPIGNRAAHARYRRASQEKRQTIYRLKRLEGSIETKVENAMVTIRRSMERVTISERFEKLTAITLEQEMERLKKGLSDTFYILNFQNALIEAHIRKATALFDFNKGLADLYLAMGTNLERYRIVAEINGKEINHDK